MELSNVRRDEITSILMIVVGIIMLLCPSFTISTLGFILGIIVLIVAAIFLIFGIVQLFTLPVGGVVSLIIGILGCYFSWALMFNPAIVSMVFSIIVYLIGIIFILFGLVNIFTSEFFAPFSLLGITGIIFGIAFIIVGIFIRVPMILAAILGIWLIISGVLSLHNDNDENYIDVNAYRYG